jgi:hypothetical protein
MLLVGCVEHKICQFGTVKKTDEGTYWDSSEFVIMTKYN